MDRLWHLKLLGQLSASRDGRELPKLPTHQTRVLLACLALRLGEDCARTELARQAWPNEDYQQAAGSFRTALSKLNRALDEDEAGRVLFADHQNVSLSAEAVTTDVADFWDARRAAEAATNPSDREQHLRRAAGLYKGDLLPGYEETWIKKERAALRRYHLDTLRDLADVCRQAGKLDEALEWAHQRVEADPLLEAARRDLMELHERQGHPAQACRVFREYEQALRDSGLGAKPGADIAALMARLQANGEAAAPTVSSGVTEARHERGAPGVLEPTDADRPVMSGDAVAAVRDAPPTVLEAPAVTVRGVVAPSDPTPRPKRLRALGVVLAVALLGAGALVGPGVWRAVSQTRAEARARQMCAVGRSAWNERSEDGYRRAHTAFTAALVAVPGYAPALSGMADTAGLRGYYGWAEPRAAFAEDEEFAGRAIAAARNDRERAQAYTSQGWADMLDWRWPEAQQDFGSALQYDPGYATAHQWYSLYLMVTGDWADSHSQAGLAEGLDMTSPVIAKSLAQRYYYTGEYPKAVAYGLEACHRNPDDALSALWLGLAYEQERDYAAALPILDRALQLSGGRDSGAWAALGHAEASSGHVPQAVEALAGLHRLRAGTRYVSSSALAIVEVGLYDRTLDPRWERQSVADLRRALSEHAGEMILLGVEPRFRSLRTDPAFAALLRAVRLPALRPPAH